ncbi:hypothetical protein DPMN_131845 [Dreissena polymorpha]|uniref:Uncharacterized protein n=1 Tax=Dreissena polymorpha TaxID=45954 RepID=A0A9D4FSP9_DREPO|nr:hypothetical protein DPMN_131845 [Dreissena polymorpha]
MYTIINSLFRTKHTPDSCQQLNRRIHHMHKRFNIVPSPSALVEEPTKGQRTSSRNEGTTNPC